MVAFSQVLHAPEWNESEEIDPKKYKSEKWSSTFHLIRMLLCAIYKIIKYFGKTDNFSPISNLFTF